MAASNSPSSKFSYPEWQAKYEAALLELEPESLSQRVHAAEAAIFNRRQALSISQDCVAERQAIEDALGALRVLMREKLNYPKWKGI